jgi:hypothetical protein
LTLSTPVSHTASLRIINLRSLELVGVIHIDGFPGGEEVERAEAFAVAVAGVYLTRECDGWGAAGRLFLELRPFQQSRA